MKILDQIGRELNFESTSKPRRVVSLVPSITELAYDLGFEIVGRTKFCIHPKNIEGSAVVGGTKNIKIEKVLSLQPDLVIANKEENTKESIEELIRSGLSVFVSDISSLEENLQLIDTLGVIGGFEARAHELSEETIAGFESFDTSKGSPRVLYLIWRDPYMAAGTDTFISDIISRVGGKNALLDREESFARYPSLTEKEIIDLKPDYILLSSEPYPFKTKHIEEIKEMTGIKTLLVDGECFSWYGSRLGKSLSYLREFSKLLQGELEK